MSFLADDGFKPPRRLDVELTFSRHKKAVREESSHGLTEAQELFNRSPAIIQKAKEAVDTLVVQLDRVCKVCDIFRD